MRMKTKTKNIIVRQGSHALQEQMSYYEKKL
jgi:hypothetical protein